MNPNNQLEAWDQTSKVIKNLISGESESQWNDQFRDTLRRTEISNPWFTHSQVITSLQGICNLLESTSLENWMHSYPVNKKEPLKIGVIMAGNIPLAGFHDFLSVISSGNILLAKLSTSDQYLLPFIADIFFSYYPSAKSLFQPVNQLKDIDAVIATGSNNTSRYFEHYFGKHPHIFRKNRNSVAVISGNENEYDFVLLGRDIFTYFGLGCRNISKFYVPAGYSFNNFFENIVSYSEVMQHNKYMNNFDYHQALYLLNRQDFLTNNFLIVIEEKSLASPVAVLHYEYYENEMELNSKLALQKNELQCVVSKNGPVHPGQTQFPSITDYADGVDTRAFLAGLTK